MPDWTVHTGDCLEVMATLPANSVDAVVTDPPYGMDWDTDSTRFSGPKQKGGPSYRNDYGEIEGDAEPFDPMPWLAFPRVVMWGANHYAQRLPVGTTLVWIKKYDDQFATFLSDAEIGWMKGGHGVYCHRAVFPPPSRIAEAGLGDTSCHPTQKPISLMRWAMRRAKIEPGMTVLDPYCGSGTTGVACVLDGINFIGIEKNAKHADTARKRIGNAVAGSGLYAGVG